MTLYTYKKHTYKYEGRAPELSVARGSSGSELVAGCAEWVGRAPDPLEELPDLLCFWSRCSLSRPRDRPELVCWSAPAVVAASGSSVGARRKAAQSSCRRSSSRSSEWIRS